MSFTKNRSGSAYAPGWFLADAEGCTRQTEQIAQNHADVITDANGGKHVPMGAIWPSNDSNAVGILYEDVDVTLGAMPGSVVTRGAVYEDRLAITGESYDAAADITSADNPTTKGWYEKTGDDSYTASSDTVAQRGKDYYTQGGSSPSYTYTKVTTVVYGDNPAALGLYERSGSSPNYVYTLSTDTQAAGSKTYYARSDVRMSANAKTALAAKGFDFIAAAPAVVRPY